MAMLALLLSLQAAPSGFVCTVTAGGAPLAGAEVVVAGRTYVTDGHGQSRIDIAPGRLEVTATKVGFAPVTTTIVVRAAAERDDRAGSHADG